MQTRRIIRLGKIQSRDVWCKNNITYIGSSDISYFVLNEVKNRYSQRKSILKTKNLSDYIDYMRYPGHRTVLMGSDHRKKKKLPQTGR